MSIYVFMDREIDTMLDAVLRVFYMVDSRGARTMYTLEFFVCFCFVKALRILVLYIEKYPGNYDHLCNFSSKEFGFGKIAIWECEKRVL